MRKLVYLIALFMVSGVVFGDVEVKWLDEVNGGITENGLLISIHVDNPDDVVKLWYGCGGYLYNPDLYPAQPTEHITDSTGLEIPVAVLEGDAAKNTAKYLNDLGEKGINIPVTEEWLNYFNGNCYVKVKYADGTTKSDSLTDDMTTTRIPPIIINDAKLEQQQIKIELILLYAYFFKNDQTALSNFDRNLGILKISCGGGVISDLCNALFSSKRFITAGELRELLNRGGYLGGWQVIKKSDTFYELVKPLPTTSFDGDMKVKITSYDNYRRSTYPIRNTEDKEIKIGRGCSIFLKDNPAYFGENMRISYNVKDPEDFEYLIFEIEGAFTPTGDAARYAFCRSSCPSEVKSIVADYWENQDINSLLELQNTRIDVANMLPYVKIRSLVKYQGGEQYECSDEAYVYYMRTVVSSNVYLPVSITDISGYEVVSYYNLDPRSNYYINLIFPKYMYEHKDQTKVTLWLQDDEGIIDKLGENNKLKELFGASSKKVVYLSELESSAEVDDSNEYVVAFKLPVEVSGEGTIAFGVMEICTYFRGSMRCIDTRDLVSQSSLFPQSVGVILSFTSASAPEEQDSTTGGNTPEQGEDTDTNTQPTQTPNEPATPPTTPTSGSSNNNGNTQPQQPTFPSGNGNNDGGAPQPQISIKRLDATVMNNQRLPVFVKVVFNVEATSPPTCELDYGDGSEIAVLQGCSQGSLIYPYSSPGTYTIKLVAKLGDKRAEKTATVTIPNVQSGTGGTLPGQNEGDSSGGLTRIRILDETSGTGSCTLTLDGREKVINVAKVGRSSLVRLSFELKVEGITLDRLNVRDVYFECKDALAYYSNYKHARLAPSIWDDFQNLQKIIIPRDYKSKGKCSFTVVTEDGSRIYCEDEVRFVWADIEDTSNRFMIQVADKSRVKRVEVQCLGTYPNSLKQFCENPSVDMLNTPISKQGLSNELNIKITLVYEKDGREYPLEYSFKISPSQGEADEFEENIPLLNEDIGNENAEENTENSDAQGDVQPASTDQTTEGEDQSAATPSTTPASQEEGETLYTFDRGRFEVIPVGYVSFIPTEILVDAYVYYPPDEPGMLPLRSYEVVRLTSPELYLYAAAVSVNTHYELKNTTALYDWEVRMGNAVNSLTLDKKTYYYLRVPYEWNGKTISQVFSSCNILRVYKLSDLTKSFERVSPSTTLSFGDIIKIMPGSVPCNVPV